MKKKLMALTLMGAMLIGGSTFAYASSNSSDTTAPTIENNSSNNNLCDKQMFKFKSKEDMQKYLSEGLSFEEAKAKVNTEKSSKIDSALANGEITQEQADIMKERLENGGNRQGKGGNRGKGRCGNKGACQMQIQE